MLVLAFGVTVFIGLLFAMSISVGVLAVAGTMGTTVRLAEFLGFLEIVTLARNEGRGRKNKKHRDNFHGAT